MELSRFFALIPESRGAGFAFEYATPPSMKPGRQRTAQSRLRFGHPTKKNCEILSIDAYLRFRLAHGQGPHFS